MRSDPIWPPALQPYQDGPVLRFRAQEIRAAVLAAPLYFVCAVVGIYGLVVAIVDCAPVSLIGGLAMLTFAGLMLLGAADSRWGSTEIERAAAGWIVRKRLWKHVRSIEIRIVSLTGAEVYRPGPGGGGPQVHVYLRHRRWPVRIGDGLGLDVEVLTALRDMFIGAM